MARVFHDPKATNTRSAAAVQRARNVSMNRDGRLHPIRPDLALHGPATPPRRPNTRMEPDAALIDEPAQEVRKAPVQYRDTPGGIVRTGKQPKQPLIRYDGPMPGRKPLPPGAIPTPFGYAADPNVINVPIPKPRVF